MPTQSPAESGTTERPAILIVDDDANITRSLSRSLRDQFTIFTANSSERALEILANEPIAVILADQRMPGLTGVELLDRARDLRPDSVGVLISGYTDVTALVDALNLGNVRGYIAKPWDLTDLRQRLSDAVHTYYAGFLDTNVLHRSSDAVNQAQSRIAELRQAVDLLASGEPYQLFLEWEQQVREQERAEELSSLGELSGGDTSTATANFNSFVEQYTTILNHVLQQHAYKDPNDPHYVRSMLRLLGERMGQAHAGPRDVVSVHLKALKQKTNQEVSQSMEEALIRESRLLLIQLLGNLASYYRTIALKGQIENQ